MKLADPMKHLAPKLRPGLVLLWAALSLSALEVVKLSGPKVDSVHQEALDWVHQEATAIVRTGAYVGGPQVSVGGVSNGVAAEISRITSNPPTISSHYTFSGGIMGQDGWEIVGYLPGPPETTLYRKGQWDSMRTGPPILSDGGPALPFITDWFGYQ